MEAGLLPPVDVVNHRGIDQAIRAIDTGLRKSWIAAGDHLGELTFPYQIRAEAAKRRLEPHALGRAIYHLAQRRGFLSNRKTRTREDEEGVVKQGISELQAAINASGHLTLGAFLASLDPRERRIRSRYTHRGMFELEFDAIAKANDWVSAESWQQIRKAIFFQRKLKSSSHLIGKCPCVPSARRCAMWHPEFQRYRILEQVCNLRVREAGGQTDRVLTVDERQALINHLGTHAQVSAAGVRKALKLKGAELSIDTVGSGKLVGDRTGAAMRAAFGDRWDTMSPQERSAALLDVHSFEKQDALRRRGEQHWKLNAQAASAFSEIQLEPGYASLSLAAISALLPHMEKGLNARQAMDVQFPGRFAIGKPTDELPPVHDALPDLRNPAVARSLTEVRRIVNRIVSKWGRPEIVRLELARDLKRSRMQRERLAKENRGQEKIREDAASRLLAETTIAQPKRSDIEKLLLAEECEFTCPYTGRRFGMHDLFGEHPSVDVEHIIPFSRSLDDSFANKTLCMAEENRAGKRNRTPFEAYGRDPERWSQVLARVERFRGSRARHKLERFLMESVGDELLDEFADRQLNDTRFASKMAALYAGRLYGGLVDGAGTRRVQASSGSVTARLRQAWRMGFALHEHGAKNRADHRHHALDAVAIALSTPAIVKRMADAAKRGAAAGRDGRLLEFSEPWPGFLEDLRDALGNVVTAHRPDRRLAGPLHEETNYSRPIKAGQEFVHRRRKGVEVLGTTDLADVPDSAIREVIDGAIKASPKGSILPGSLPRTSAQSPERVRHVRVPADRTPVLLPARKGNRWVAPASNHHMAVYAVRIGDKERWEVEVVTRLEAHRRKRSGEAIIRRDRGDGSRFMFSLRSGDTLRMRGENGEITFAVVKGVSGTTIEGLGCNDARPAKEVRKAGTRAGRMVLSPIALQRGNAARVDVSPIGEITVSHD